MRGACLFIEYDVTTIWYFWLIIVTVVIFIINVIFLFNIIHLLDWLTNWSLITLKY